MFLITAWDGAVLGCCGIGKLDGEHPEIGYWLGVPFWGKGYATEAARALIDHAFGDLGYEVLVSGARVSNPASRRVLEKCGFEWTGVGLYRIRALASSAPIDRFRLDRGLWASLKSWGKVHSGACARDCLASRARGGRRGASSVAIGAAFRAAVVPL